MECPRNTFFRQVGTAIVQLLIKMGSVGKDDEFLPVSYNVEDSLIFG